MVASLNSSSYEVAIRITARIACQLNIKWVSEKGNIKRSSIEVGAAIRNVKALPSILSFATEYLSLRLHIV